MSTAFNLRAAAFVFVAMICNVQCLPGQSPSQSSPRQTTSLSPRPDNEQWQIDRFQTFSQLMWNDDFLIRKNIEEGKPPYSGVGSWKSLGITDGEEKLMRIVLTDAFERYQKREKAGLGIPPAQTRTPAEMRLLVNQLQEDTNQIYRDAIARIKQQFSAEHFKKLDDELYRIDMPHRIVTKGAGKQTSSAPSETPNSDNRTGAPK